MVKRALRIFMLLALLLTAILAAGGWWLLGSPGGARWLLAELSRRTAVSVTAERVEGRLYDELHLQGVHIVWPGGEARLADCRLSWRPLRLLDGDLQVEALELSGGFLAWEVTAPAEAEAAAPFAWPRLDGLPLRLRGTLAALRLADLELRPPEGAPQRLERLTTKLQWQGGVLALSGVEADAEGYRLQGSAAAGFAEPQLRLDLLLSLPEAAAGVDAIVLQAELAATSGAVLSGPLELSARHRAQPQALIAAEIELQGEALRLERFDLSLPGRPDVLSGSGARGLRPAGAWRRACAASTWLRRRG